MAALIDTDIASRHAVIAPAAAPFSTNGAELAARGSTLL
jgi:hypothetical protein